MKKDKKSLYFLKGGGEIGEFMRTKDWSNTPLGNPETWSQSLRTSLSILLNCRFPMFLFWGDELCCFYNDAYRPSLGIEGKHPTIFGAPGNEAWPEIWEEIEPMLRNVISKGETFYFENRLIPILRNGKIEDVYWTFSYSPVINETGEVSGVMVVCTETTNQVISNKVLVESERRFRELADNAPLWIWITDIDINMEYVNKKLLNFIGISSYQEFTGKLWKDVVHPDDIDIVFDAFEEAVKNCSEFSFEVRVKHSETGIYEWFIINAIPRMYDKKLKGFIGTGVSIEKQKTFTYKLAKEVKKRTEELALSNKNLVQTNEELKSFTYISSHDLREPLRKIQTFCSMLETVEKQNLSKTGMDYFNRIRSAANRMQNLIDDLLMYSRTEVGEANFDTISLKELVDNVLDTLSEEIESNNVKLNVKVPHDIRVIKFQFSQLLFNLISNSIKYSKSGTVPFIEISSEKVDMANYDDTKLPAEGNYFLITVRDNGIGFENQYAQKIFDLFQRLHTRDQYLGTGIGLSIVRKIVNIHKGFIRASGKPNKGAKFEVFIPIHK